MHLPILNLDSGDIPPLMLVVGDPSRARRAAARLEAEEEISHNREYLTLVGRHRGVEVGVVSHGVGAAGAAVCFEELLRAGVRRVIRAGTCGGMQEEVTDGHLVIVTGAVRNDGFTNQIVPYGYPALASTDVIAALRGAASDHPDLHEGLSLTGAVFYSHEILGSDLTLWQKTGVKVVEMECAVLFVLGGLAGVETGAILTVDGNPLLRADAEMNAYNPHREVVQEAVGQMIDIAFDALIDQPA